nr:MAG TPA: hypothetical protein [Caudoviricetes sp.]
MRIPSTARRKNFFISRTSSQKYLYYTYIIYILYYIFFLVSIIQQLSLTRGKIFVIIVVEIHRGKR